jgi:hypothetical protein
MDCVLFVLSRLCCMEVKCSDMGASTVPGLWVCMLHLEPCAISRWFSRDGVPPYADVRLSVVANQPYDVSLHLTVPAIPSNYELGNFMASITISTPANKTLIHARRPVRMLSTLHRFILPNWHRHSFFHHLPAFFPFTLNVPLSRSPFHYSLHIPLESAKPLLMWRLDDATIGEASARVRDENSASLLQRSRAQLHIGAFGTYLLSFAYMSMLIHISADYSHASRYSPACSHRGRSLSSLQPLCSDVFLQRLSCAPQTNP